MLTNNSWNHAFLEMMSCGEMIEQLDAEFVHYCQNGLLIPATISVPRSGNCYAVSPLSLIENYALDEIPKLRSALLRRACQLLIKTLVWPLSRAGLGNVQTLNNQCLSTNMYSPGWNDMDLSALREHALNAAPDKALQLRSLNQVQHKAVIQLARQDGWIPVVTRQVYLHGNWPQFHPGTDFKRDVKLLQETDWRISPLTEPDEFKQAKRLYDMLYLDKYSQHSIRFTTKYIEQSVRRGLLKLYGLFYQQEMLAACGMVIIDGDMTCPIFGYDTSRPLSFALYRRLSVFTIDYARKHNLRFNMSSGAPMFKTHRGAKAEIEYSYVYINHLTPFKRLVWRTLSWLTIQVYQRILEKYEL